MTPYQKKQAQASIKVFRRKILDTNPCNRERAERAITDLRRMAAEGALANSGRPPIFVWVQSPREFVALLKEATKTGSLAQYNYGRKEFLSEKVQRIFASNPIVVGSRTADAWGVSPDSPTLHFSDLGLYARLLDFGHRISHMLDPARCLTEIIDDKMTSLPLSRELLRPEMGQFEIDRIWSDNFIGEHYPQVEAKGARGFELTQKLLEVATSCTFWWNHASAVFICERPKSIHVDDRGRLHSTKGPSVEFHDGLKLYAICGIEMKSEIFEDGKVTLTADMISHTRNAEVRRVLMEMYGQEKYLKDTGAFVINEGRDGRKLWMRPQADDEETGIPLVMVELINSTPEPDGTHKHYFLRVAPNIRNADEAVASTFRMGSDDYDPRIET